MFGACPRRARARAAVRGEADALQGVEVLLEVVSQVGGQGESRAISWRARRRREQLGSPRSLLFGRQRCSQARLGLDRLAAGATTSQAPCARSTATHLSPGRDDARGGELAFLRFRAFEQRHKLLGFPHVETVPKLMSQMQSFWHVGQEQLGTSLFENVEPLHTCVAALQEV